MDISLKGSNALPGLSASDSLEPGDIFVTTRWTLVLAAADRTLPQAERALEEICRTYWFPLYAYIRRRGRSAEDAEDLTQEFFRQLLEHRWIEDVDREKGRLRAFLITALKHFIAKEWRRVSSQKRGGGQFHLSIDTEGAEGRYAAAVAPKLEAEMLFDHQWAVTLLELTIQRLKTEYADDARFAVLKEGLFMAHESIDYPALASALGSSAGAARVAVHRMRKRFRELYRVEVAQTLPPGTDLDEEMHYLAECLAQG